MFRASFTRFCLPLIAVTTASFAPHVMAKPRRPVTSHQTVLPRKDAPEGMLELPANGSGRVLTSHMSGTRSARKMLMGLRMGIAGYFDAKPFIGSAFADRRDQNLQAAFTAKLKGVPVRGIISIEMDGDSGQGTLIFDRAAAFGQSFPRLIRTVNGSSGPNGSPGSNGSRRAPAPVHLTTAQLLDGSGQIGLPPGWRVTGSYKGVVDAQGPDGAGLSLGAAMTVASPATRGRYEGIPMVDFNDPVQAAIDYTNYQTNRARAQGRPSSHLTKIWDTAPAQMPGGRAAFIRFSFAAGGQTFEGLGLYSIMPIDEEQGLLYMSYVNAPTAVFNKALPGMIAAWQSWGISDGVVRERMNNALNSMKGTGDILTGANANRQDTYAKVNKAWDQVIRDEGTWRNPDTGQRYVGSTQEFDHNQHIGSLEPVPLADN